MSVVGVDGVVVFVISVLIRKYALTSNHWADAQWTATHNIARMGKKRRVQHLYRKLMSLTCFRRVYTCDTYIQHVRTPLNGDSLLHIVSSCEFYVLCVFCVLIKTNDFSPLPFLICSFSLFVTRALFVSPFLLTWSNFRMDGWLDDDDDDDWITTTTKSTGSRNYLKKLVA